MSSRVQTLNQQRAEFALSEIKNIKNQPDNKKKQKYSRNARRLPSLIVSNGLVPTLAFLKSKEEMKDVYETVNKWLKDRGYVQNDALEELIKTDFINLRLATMEALEFANWLKRMAEIELE